MYPKNNASPPTLAVGSIYLIADGTIQTSGASVRVLTAGGAWGAGGGTLAYDTTSGAITYTPTQAETNGEWFMVAVYKASCTSASITVVTTAESTAGKVSLGAAQTAAITGNITGNLSGSVGSVTGAVGSVTGAVGSVTGAVGSVTGAVGSVTAGVTLANGAITDASLAGAMEIVFETDFATNYNTTRNAWATNVQDFVGTTAADPFNGKIVAASVTTKTGYSLAADQSAVTIGTVTTLTGHTAQTGDTYALAAGATGFAAIDTVVDAILVDTGTTIPTALEDMPTVAEFNARTLAAASYFDPAADTVANVTTVGSVTTKTGYSLTADQSAVTIGTVTTLTNWHASVTDWTDGERLDIILDTIAAGASADTVAAAVWDKVQSDHTTAGTFGEIATEIAALAPGAATNITTETTIIQMD